MTTSTFRGVRGRVRVVDPASWALLALATCWWVRALLHERMLDLRVYRAGAAALLAHSGIYLSHHDPSDPVPSGVLNFTYPPFAAALFTPFAVLPWPLVVALLTAAGVGALAYTLRLVLRALGRPVGTAPVLAVAAMLLGPVGWPQGTLVMGQVNLLLLALVAGDLLGPRRRWTGALTGVAAGVKLTPAIFLVYLALTGRRKEAATGAGVAALTGLAGFALAPGDSWLFWTRLWWDPGHVGDQAYAANQSLGGALARLGVPGAGAPLTLAVVVLGLAVARRAYRAGDDLWGVLVTAVTGLLVSPISWQHHWVWAIPVAVVLWHRSRALAVLWVLPFAVQPMWWHTTGAVHAVAANAVTIAGLALLAAAPMIVRDRPAIQSAVWDRLPLASSAGGSRSGAPSGRVATRAPSRAWSWLTAPEPSPHSPPS